MNMKDHTSWCRSLFEQLREGELWAVPRSGMLFCRRGNILAWAASFPPELKLDKNYAIIREAEFASTCFMFGNAGIKIGRATEILLFDDCEQAIAYLREHYHELQRVN